MGKRRGWTIAALTVMCAAAGFALLPKTARLASPVLPPTPAQLPRLDGAAIVLPDAFVKLAGIETAAVTERVVARQLNVPGQVALDPEHVAAVGTRARGLVQKIYKFEGDLVDPDELLARVDSPELSHAQGDALALAARAQATMANERRETSLRQAGMTSERDVELAKASAAEHHAQLAAARAKVAMLSGSRVETMGVYGLRAPLAGVVIERLIHAGQTVEANVVAFRVANLDQLWVELAVGERYLDGIRRGDPVEIRPIAHPDARVTGQIAYVGDVIDPLTGTAPVRVVLGNRERLLRPGQSVTARIHLSHADGPVPAVQESAVTPIDGKPHVFLALGPNRVQPTPVELGAADDGWVEIRAGVQAGDRVVTRGVFALKSELFR